jgi:hypothetical protein
MNQTSDGSPAKAKEFLANYVDVENLKKARIPTNFDQLTKGEVPEDIKSKAEAGIITV